MGNGSRCVSWPWRVSPQGICCIGYGVSAQQARAGSRFAAVPGERGGQDIPYLAKRDGQRTCDASGARGLDVV